MNFGGFQALSQLWLLSLLLPLVLLYFLKLKRPRVTVPSLVLWQQVLQDHRVNAPFQRFKRNLLLLLQILLLLLLVLAALQPFWRGNSAPRQRLPVLVDASASMGALDKPGGSTRLEEAKQRVRQMIDGLAPDQELCLVSFSRIARKRCGFTNNKRLLREVLDGIEVENVPSDLEDALRLVQALARSEPFDEVLLFSDGNLPPRVSIDLSFKLNYQVLTPAGPNFGITALTAQRAADGGWNVFAQIESSVNAEGTLTLDLTQDAQPAGNERVVLTRGRAERLMFRVKGATASALKLRLAAGTFDSLAADNDAELDLPAARPLRVFVSPTLAAYRHALAGLPDLQIFPQENAAASAGAFDLVISDRAEDFEIATPMRLSIGLVPPQLSNLLAIGSDGSQVIDWRRSAALFQHVELGDLAIMDRPHWQNNGSEGALENLGFEILAHGSQGPLVLSRRDGGTQQIALLFHTDRSTLPYRVGFPILVANVVHAAQQQAGLAEVHGLRSLLSSTETTLGSIDHLEFNEQLSVAPASTSVKADFPLWPWLVVAALGLLQLEWWYFQRRPGGWRQL